MKSLFMFILLFIAVSLIGCAEEKDPNVFMETKNKFGEQIKDRMDTIQSDLDALSEQLGDATGDAADDIKDKIRDLTDQRSTIEKQMDKIKGASEDGWDELKSSIESGLDSIDKSIQELSSELSDSL